MIEVVAAPQLATPPERVPAPEECFFYHTADLGSLGKFRGQWDLVPHLDDYWAGTDFSGRRVLEIGPASGLLTAELEARGARVAALELAAGDDWDVVPFDGWDPSEFLAARSRLQDRMRNSFWRTHAARELEAQLFLGSAYNIPPAVGDFDVATVCAVLLHLRRPLDALQQIAARVGEAVVVAEPLPGECLDAESSALLRRANSNGGAEALARCLSLLGPGELEDPPAAYFRPRASARAPKETWWSFTPSFLRAWLEVLGFQVETPRLYVLEHDSAFAFHKPEGHEERRTWHPYFTLVARRDAGPSAP